MEDAYGILFISEGYIPTIGWNIKEFDVHEGWIMGGSWQKGTRNDTTKPGSICGFQYFERKYNEGVDACIG